jgi:hypothetical protein
MHELKPCDTTCYDASGPLKRSDRLPPLPGFDDSIRNFEYRGTVPAAIGKGLTPLVSASALFHVQQLMMFVYKYHPHIIIIIITSF